MRIGGMIIWATDFREEKTTSSQGGGKGGGGGKVKTTEYFYYARFAVALCEGPITGIGRIWADGKLLDTSGITLRWYSGDEAQEPDPMIGSKMGTDATPAYRGTAYVVFDDMPLQDHGNRLPQLSFEVFRTLTVDGGAETLIRGVSLMPSLGEFAYGTTAVRSGADGAEVTANVHAHADRTDFLVSLETLEASLPNFEAVSLVVSWFGDDLRAGACRLRPAVEMSARETRPEIWSVNGVDRASALVVSQDGDGAPVFGGTPADFTVVEAIQELKARGLRVTFSPSLVMDVPPGNALPDPYSDNAGSVGQGAYPWSGRITCSPATGYGGSADKTAAAGTQIADFFGEATAAEFYVTNKTVTWTGAPDAPDAANAWGYRRIILYYAHLCAAAGGVDTFLIGSQVPGLTRVRSDANTYPAVQALRDLAADVRVILGPGTAISYAADWSEYFGHHADDSSGDVFFHLDPLWSDPVVTFVGIDNFMPVADWCDGTAHLDAEAGWPNIHDWGYLTSNMAGGEGFDWRYASPADRAAQVRTTITDAGAKPWVFRPKDIRSWWGNAHYDRPGGVEAASPTAWNPQMKPIRFTAVGCPAIDRGANQPSAVYDPKSSDSAVPHFSRGWRDDTMQRAYLEASLQFWGDAENNGANNPEGMVDLANSAAWSWDARPYPHFPDLSNIWPDTSNWQLGHWLAGRLGAASLPALVSELCLRAGLPANRFDASGLVGSVEGMVINALESPRASVSTLARHFGFDAFESEGLVRFAMRDRAATMVLTHADLLSDVQGEVIELTRGQETELSQALKWQVVRADGDFDPAQVEARRITSGSRRVNLESFPLAVSLEEAERRCIRALAEEWAGREKATFRLPPSRLALDPSDVVVLEHDGRRLSMRLVSISDAGARGIEAVRQDQQAYDGPPGAARPSRLTTPPVFGTPIAVLMDLPQLSEETPAHRPMVAAYAQPWPGEMAVLRSPTEDGFSMVTSVGVPSQIGAVAVEFPAGPVSRFDHSNALIVDLYSGTLQSVTDLALFSGANALPIESRQHLGVGVWEIVQAGEIELIGARRYRLTRLLRGQRGTEGAIGDPAPVGSRVVVLDDTLSSLPIAQADLGIPYNWQIGPASRPVSDDTYVARAFTPEGIGLRPFSVAHVQQPYLRPHVPGDLTISWTRRSRALSADSWTGLEVPIIEGNEAYEVEILDGASVLRTLSSNSTSVIYTAAAQTADWGTLLGPGDTLNIRIFQLSDLIGRGSPKSVTLIF
jgi:hypothetical protein